MGADGEEDEDGRYHDKHIRSYLTEGAVKEGTHLFNRWLLWRKCDR